MSDQQLDQEPPGHLAAIDPTAESEDPGGAAPDLDAPTEGLRADGCLSCEAWTAQLAVALQLAGLATALQTLATAHERDTFAGAAAAIYQTADESPALRWMLRPAGRWVARLVAIAAFAGPLGRDIAAELAARDEDEDLADEDPPERDGRNGHGG